MTTQRTITINVDWTPEELASRSADPELNQKTWDELSSKTKADTTREEWKRHGPGGYERWRRFVWQDGDIEIFSPEKQ